MVFHDDKDGSEKAVKVPLGESLLEAAHANDIDLEGEHNRIYVCYSVEHGVHAAHSHMWCVLAGEQWVGACVSIARLQLFAWWLRDGLLDTH